MEKMKCQGKYEEDIADQNWDNLSNFDTFNAYSYFDMFCLAAGRESTLHIRNQGVFDAFTYNQGLQDNAWGCHS